MNEGESRGVGERGEHRVLDCDARLHVGRRETAHFSDSRRELRGGHVEQRSVHVLARVAVPEERARPEACTCTSTRDCRTNSERKTYNHAPSHALPSNRIISL